jgi:hypothetical protein
LVLTAACFGAGPPGEVLSVIEATRTEDNVVSASQSFHATRKFILSSEFIISIKPFHTELILQQLNYQ